MDQELAFTSASELRQLIAGKQVSPVEVTEAYLRRIDRLDPGLQRLPDRCRRRDRVGQGR